MNEGVLDSYVLVISDKGKIITKNTSTTEIKHILNKYNL
jgi:hypothetical protein